MSSFVSRWVVCERHAVDATDVDADGVVRDDAVAQWIAAARDAYLELCTVLRALQKERGLVLQARGDVPRGDLFGKATAVVVSAGVTEVFPTSFTMAFRLRTHSSGDDVVINAATVVSLEDAGTGAAVELGDDVRDELIASEHSARHTN